MSESKRPPYRRREPRELTSPGDRSGKDLNDVFRDILLDAMDEQGWERIDVQKKLEWSQASASRKLSGKAPAGSGFTLTDLGHLCNALDEDPVKLFARFPGYTADARAGRTYPKDHLYSRYNALLRNAEAHGLLSDLQEARDLGVFNRCLEAVRNVVVTASETRSKLAADRRKSAPRRTRAERQKPP